MRFESTLMVSCRSQEVNLKEEVRISTIVGSHSNIVYMKEFVENKDKYFIVLEYLTGGELFDRFAIILET
jgi:serine/threonine protein kinase